MRKVVISLVCLASALASAPRGHTETISPASHAEALKAGLLSDDEAVDLFRLWNECRPVRFTVHLTNQEIATEIGLQKIEVETMVRSRLRAARIFIDSSTKSPELDSNGFLLISIHLGDTIFSWKAEYQKVMKDISTELVSWASTGWRQSSFGGHRHDGYYVLSVVSLGIDKFIDRYLFVNEASCDAKEKTDPKPAGYTLRPVDFTPQPIKHDNAPERNIGPSE